MILLKSEYQHIIVQMEVFHSETGRISLLRMHPMSLFESGDSTGEASILDMINGSINNGSWLRNEHIHVMLI